MKRRVLSIVAAVAMAVMLIPTAAFAARGEAEEGHNHADGYCAVCGEGVPASEEEAEIPEEEAESVAFIGDAGYPTLKAALNAAGYGDTILLATDIDLTQAITIDKQITLDGGYHTIRRDFSGDALFNLKDGASVRLTAITLDGTSEYYTGYSLFNVLEHAELVIDSETTLRNSSAEYGGAVYIKEDGVLRMTSGQIIDCSAENSGGAIYNDGTVYLSGDSLLSGNTGYWGGAIRSSGDVYVSGGVRATDNYDYHDGEDNLHLERADALCLDGDFYGVIALNTNEVGAYEGQVVGRVNYPVEGAEGIVSDYDTSYFGKITDENIIILTTGEAPSYTVTFDTQADDVYDPESQTVEEGSYATDPGELYREGYTFDGWYEDYAEYPYDFNTPVEADISLYARWSEAETDPTVYAVSFYVDGIGIAPDTQEVTEGEAAQRPEDPTAEGYTFEGWYADPELTEWYDFDAAVYNNVDLYAAWSEVPTEEEPSEDGEDAPVVSVIDGTDELNALIDAQNNGSDVDTVIDTADTDADADIHNPGDDAQDDGNNGDDGQGAVDPDNGATDDPNSGAADDDNQDDGTAGDGADGQDQPATDPETEPATPSTFTVTFYTAHGTAPQSQTIEEGKTVSKPEDPTDDNYIFGGWYTDEELTSAYDFNAPVNGYLILYAKWTEKPTEAPDVETYSVTFYSAHSAQLPGQLIEEGKTVEKPADPTANGYVFEGWYTDIEYTNAYDFNAPVTQSLTLYAKWSEEETTIEYFDVNFYSERGMVPAAQNVQKGMRVPKPTDPSADGYVFGGWYTDSEFSNLFDFNTEITRNMTLYAKWVELPVENYIVSFDANGHGNTPNPQTVKTGELVTKPTDPTAIGYSFVGWYEDAACTQAFNFRAPVSYNVTLYAGWNANRYTVKFDSNGGAGTMSSQSYVYDTKGNLPVNTFSRTGYYFVGWNTEADGSGQAIADNGEILNLTAVSGGTVDLYAQWRNIYNVLEGIDAKVTKGGTSALTFRVDGDYSKFTGIRIDNNNVAASQYTSWSGSTYVQLKPEYINQMPTGSHTIKFMYTDGSVETNFEVLSRTPTTGDTNNALIWIIIAIAALIVIALILLILLGKRRRNRYDDYDDDGYPGGYDDRYDDRVYRDRYDDDYNDRYDGRRNSGRYDDRDYDDRYDDDYDDRRGGRR